MRFGFHCLETVESTDDTAWVGIALSQLFEKVMEFGVYGEVEDGSEDFR